MPDIEQVRCLDCGRYTPDAKNPEFGTGHCVNINWAWDDHQLQYPQKLHPCWAFIPKDEAA